MEALIFLMILIILVLIIIIFSKIGNIIKDIQNTNLNINSVNSKLINLLQTSVNKKDAEEMKSILLDIKHREAFNVDKVDNRVIEKLETAKQTETRDADKKENHVIDPSIEQILNAVAASSQEKETEEKIEETEPTTNSPYASQNRDDQEDKVVEEVSNIIDKKEDEGITIQEEAAKPVYADLPLIPRRYIPDRRENTEVVFEKSFLEKFFSENLLTKIGIITLVLGVAFFVKYAIDQDWINEVGRVGIGILTGAILIGIAHKLRTNYHVFSALLVGGGIAVFYFTITLAFREYELFSQSVAFILLIVVTILSVAFSLLYDRKELAIFSLVGGFASPLMISTGDGNYVVLFTFILILNTGMLVISLRKNWHIIGTISYILTAIFYLTWLFSSFNDQIIGGLTFAILFFVQFYILTVIDHFKANSKLSAYHAILLLTNNLILLASTLTLLNNKPDFRGVAIITIAVFNAVAMIALYKTKKVDSNLIYLLIAIIMSLVTLAIPIQLNGNAITMFWAAESVILLWLWKRSQIKTFSFGFVGVTILFFLSYLMDLANYYNLTYTYLTDEGHPAILFNRTFMTGLVIVLSYVANIWLTKDKDNDRPFIFSITLNTMNKIFKVLLVIFTYAVLHIELDLQLAYYTDVSYYSSFRYLGLVSFAGLYVALLTAVIPRKIRQTDIIYGMLFAFVVIYSFVFIGITVELRDNIFNFYKIPSYPSYYFLIHFLPLIALIVIIRSMAKISKDKSSVLYQVFCWVMSLVSVMVLSIEAENIAIMMFNNFDSENYRYVLSQVRTFVFPILWGVIAMILMIWGLKAREVVLRKISLVFFAVIIVKFYAYDVWRMSQAGRIISFVLLGVILLVVSFLQQKIKTLVKKDDVKDEIDNNNDGNTTIQN